VTRLPVAVGAVLLVAAACGSSSLVAQKAATSPTPDAATRAYVSLIRAYWNALHVADTTADGSDADAGPCLGESSPTSPSDLKVVLPQACRTYAVATLAAHEKFFAALDTVPTPPSFAADDTVFRRDIPKAITDMTTLIAACGGSSRQAIVDAMRAYAELMIPEVTDALDHVDPSVRHIEPHAG